MFLHLKVKPNPRLLISHKHFKVQSNFFLRSEGMKLSIENTSDISIHRYIYIRRSTDICIHILQNPSLNSLQVLLKNSLYLVGLGETYLNQARSALQQDFSGKAVDCVMEAVNVLARLVLADVLVVSHVWFTLYFCSHHGTFPEHSYKVVYSDSVEDIQPCPDMQEFNCDDYDVSKSCIVHSNWRQERSNLFWYAAGILSPVLSAFLISWLLRIT